MKKSLVLGLAIVVLLVICSLNTALGLVSVSSSTQTFGFQNGSYMGFTDAMSFTTAGDTPSGGTQQIVGSNASFPNWMFFQVQGSSEIYGFFASGCNFTISNYFVDSYLQFTTDGAGIVKVYVGTLGIPTIVTGGTSGSFDSTLNVAVLTITSATSVRINFGGGPGPGPSNPTPTPVPGGPGGNPTPTPISSVTPNPTGPTLAPTPIPTLGTNDFQVSDITLGTVHPNSTATANLHFRFSGSSYNLQSISLPEPFNSWYVPNGNFTTLVYMLNTGGESSGDVTLSFAVGNETTQSYSGSFSVSAMDAFGTVHTSTGTINADVSSNSRFDIVGFFKLHPLYIVLVAVVIGVLLAALVLFSKRRR